MKDVKSCFEDVVNKLTELPFLKNTQLTQIHTHTNTRIQMPWVPLILLDINIHLLTLHTLTVHSRTVQQRNTPH